MEYDYPLVGRSHWALADREAAEDVGTAFVNAFRRMGVDFDDIGLEPPIDCRAKPRPPCCAVDEYRIALGRITLDDAKRMTARVTVLLDELAGYRAGPGNP